jgi:hypothetical protein
MTPNLSPNYAHWAAGAALVLALICYALTWTGAAIVGFVFGLVFEVLFWLLPPYGQDDE